MSGLQTRQQGEREDADEERATSRIWDAANKMCTTTSRQQHVPCVKFMCKGRRYEARKGHLVSPHSGEGEGEPHDLLFSRPCVPSSLCSDRPASAVLGKGKAGFLIKSPNATAVTASLILGRRLLMKSPDSDSMQRLLNRVARRQINLPLNVWLLLPACLSFAAPLPRLLSSSLSAQAHVLSATRRVSGGFLFSTNDCQFLLDLINFPSRGVFCRPKRLRITRSALRSGKEK